MRQKSINSWLSTILTPEELLQKISRRSDFSRKTDGITPIVCLAKHGKWDLVTSLATKNKASNTNDRYDYATALALAIRKNKNDAARILIDAGAPIDKLLTYQKNTMNLLQWALFHGNREIADLLIQKNPEFSLNLSMKYNGLTLVAHLAKHGQWDLVEKFTSQYKNDEKDSFGYLAVINLAIQHNQIAAAKSLINACDPFLNRLFYYRSQNMTVNLLHTALIHNNKEIAQLLIKKCPVLVLDKVDAPENPKYHGKTALLLAVDNQDFSTIKLIASRVIKSDPDNTLGVNEALALAVSTIQSNNTFDSLFKPDVADIMNARIKAREVVNSIMAVNVEKLVSRFYAASNKFFGLFSASESKELVAYLKSQVKEKDTGNIQSQQMADNITKAVENFVSERFSNNNYSRAGMVQLLMTCSLITEDKVGELENITKNLKRHSNSL